MEKIKKIGVLSLAKVLGLLYVFIGLIIGVIIILITFLSPESNTSSIAITLISGIILFPILYGFLGFISGLLMGYLYNLTTSWIGGIEVEIKKK